LTQSKAEEITYYWGEPAAVVMLPHNCWDGDFT